MTHYHTSINGESVTIPQELIAKCDKPIPRYTSYPTVPVWTEVDENQVASAMARSNAEKRPVSLYFHIPFCEEMCHFCGCNTIITKKHVVADGYIDHLEKEMDLIAPNVDASRKVVQLHFGGGTPTYLSLEQTRRLWNAIRYRFTLDAESENSIEVDPRVTTNEQLELLRELGANRISMGVQDNDDVVQKAINRIQPIETTRRVVTTARALGYHSVNIDLMYGLPHQTPEGFAQTVDEIIALSPDRIALFNFAYVPWLKAHQKKLNVASLPSAHIKFTMFCKTIEQLYKAGYMFVGMDHFAKTTDELYTAIEKRTMWRNFQGYTTRRGVDLHAFGITAISDLHDLYYQNVKKLSEYSRMVTEGTLALERGVQLTHDDILRRSVITELFCNHHLDKASIEKQFNIRFDDYFASSLASLEPLIADGLATASSSSIDITNLGKLFVRNVASVFDAYLQNKNENSPLFSRAV